MTTAEVNLWNHPTLDLFAPIPQPQMKKVRLYLAPTTFGEKFERDDCPQPTPSAELPELRKWIASYAISVLEVWNGRRQPAQLVARTHYVIFNQLLRDMGMLKTVGKIKRMHLEEPLDGVCEAALTVELNGRIRAMVIRCEGVDGRWLCTALDLI